MRPLGVVVLLPDVDNRAGVGEAAKPLQILALITERAVEALDVGVLRRFAGLDEIQRDAMRIGLSIQDLPRELGSVVDGDLLGRAIGIGIRRAGRGPASPDP